MQKIYRKVEVERLMAEAEESGQADAGWLATMADMMTLLLTFFIMLLSLSAPKSGDYLETLSEMGAAMGGKSLVEVYKDQEKKQKEIKENIKRIIQDNNLVNEIELTSDTRGLVLYSRGDFFFKAGSSEILDDTKLFLKRISKILKDSDGQILVEGHTDDVPIKSALYPSNWELSTGRAASVVRFFIEEEKLEPKRFIVSGYAEYKPRFSVTPENRGKNRRVEIVILRPKK